jgi:AraC-like DNA-binding protein
MMTWLDLTPACLILTSMPDLTFGHWGFDRNRPGTVFGPRRFIDYDLIIIEAGDVVWEVDGVRHAAPAPSLLIGRPGLTDRIHWDPRRESRNTYLHFSMRRPPPGLPPPAAWPLVRHLSGGDVIRPLMHHALWLLERRPPGHAALAAMAVLHMLTAGVLGLTATAGSAEARLPPLVEAAIGHLVRRWGGRLHLVQVGEVAAAVGVSEGHLNRVFAAAVGHPPAEALRLVRLEHAATLLAQQDLPIATVATAVGFADQFHFSRRFAAAYGCPPTAYRQRMREGAPGGHAASAGIRALCRRLWEEGISEG